MRMGRESREGWKGKEGGGREPGQECEEERRKEDRECRWRRHGCREERAEV